MELIARTIERFGKIDILVNNAAMFAVLHETECTEIDAVLWDRVMAVNLRGPFLMVKHVVPHMKARQYGKIINIGSGAAYRGVPMLLHYSSTFARTRSTRHPRQHVRARFHLERLRRGAKPRARTHCSTAGIAGRAIPRDEHPHDLLGALIFLASSESDFITGQNIAVDGGNVNT